MLGGFFNLTLGTLLGLAPAKAVAILHIPPPAPGFYLQMLATLAALLGCYYLLAASDVRRHTGIVVLAISGRFLVGFVLLLAAVRDPSLSGLNVLAGAEVLLGSIHAVSWWSIR